MQQVTTKKFAEMCGVSDANIRGMISRGSLVATKDVQGNNLLDIEDGKNRSYLDSKRKITQSSAQVVTDIAKDVTQFSNVGYTDSYERITQRIEELAKLAGKAEQLEDSIIERKNDVKEWQDRYFELQHINEQLRNDNARLTLNNESLEKELECAKQELKQERKKPFWKRSVL